MEVSNVPFRRRCGKCLTNSLILVILLVVFLTAGTFTTVLAKVQNQYFVKDAGCPLPPSPFYHPIFQTICVMFAYSTVGIVVLIRWVVCSSSLCGRSWCRRRKPHDDADESDVDGLLIVTPVQPTVHNLDDDDGDDAVVVVVPKEQQETKDGLSSSADVPADEEKELSSSSSKKNASKCQFNLIFLIFPACANIFGNICIFIGLLYTWGAIYQMLTSFIVIDCAFLTIFVFRRCPNISQVVGIIWIIVGAFVVGVSSLWRPADVAQQYPAAGILFGWGMCLLGMLGFAAEYIMQELFIKRKWPRENKQHNDEITFWTDPTSVIFVEGCWGVLITLFCGFIGTVFSLDKVADAFIAMRTDKGILGVVTIGEIVSLAAMDLLGVILITRGSSTFRAMASCLRMVTVWVVQMIRGQDMFSWMRLGGMLAIIAGNIIYNLNITTSDVGRWCCRKKRKEKEEEEERKRLISLDT